MRPRTTLFMALLVISGWLLVASPPTSQSNTPANFIRFAAVGDYGAVNANALAVANLIASWNPDFVITQGDNNYLDDSSTVGWDTAVGQYYGAYIHYPLTSTSVYAPGSPMNRFFPSLGNHDWTAGLGGWNAYFELPGNERYYDFVQGPVHFFVLDSDPREPDDTTATSTQGQWLQAQLAASTAPWQIVYFHHPPYSSAQNGNYVWMQWPFQAWGADAVLAGHDHVYERIVRAGFPYFVNGFGGKSGATFGTPQPDSVVRYNANYGAMLIEATPLTMTFKAFSVANGSTLIDAFTLDHLHPLSDPLVTASARWKYLDTGTDQGAGWIAPAFNDSAWASGPAKLGYGDSDVVTSLNYGPDPNNKYITTYFRHTFSVTNPSRYRSLTLEVQRDDGAVVYLNGVEAWRTNIPSGVITYTTPSASLVGGGDETAFFTTRLNSSYLVTGTNVLAVEVHQISGASSDLGFNLALWGDPPYTVYLPLMKK